MMQIIYRRIKAATQPPFFIAVAVVGLVFEFLVEFPFMVAMLVTDITDAFGRRP